jgi:hypothetical protein
MPSLPSTSSSKLRKPIIPNQSNIKYKERAAPYLKRLVGDFPPRRPGFDPGSGQVGFVDKVALGQVFSEYSGFPCQSSFHQLLHNHPHLSSGAGTIGQKWLQYKGLSPTPLAITESMKENPMFGSKGSVTCKMMYKVGEKIANPAKE